MFNFFTLDNIFNFELVKKFNFFNKFVLLEDKRLRLSGVNKWQMLSSGPKFREIPTHKGFPYDFGKSAYLEKVPIKSAEV